MSNRRHFHPFSIVIGVAKALQNSFFLILIILFRGGWGSLYSYLGIAVLVLIDCVYALVSYFSQFYEVTPEKLVLYRGIFNRREIDIPYDRIQTIKKKQWFFFRPFQIVELQIETAGGESNRAEANFPAVKESVLALIEQRRLNKKAESTGVQPLAPGGTESPVLKESGVSSGSLFQYRLSDTDILWFSFTDLGILAAGLALLTFVDDIPGSWFQQASEYTLHLIRQSVWLMGAAAVLMLILIVLISVAKNFFQLYRFTVVRTDDSLLIEKGLFQRNLQTIPVRKIQGIKIKQPFLRRLLGFASAEILLAGGQEEEKEQGGNSAVYLIPLIRTRHLFGALHELLPEWEVQAPELQYTSRSRAWYFYRWYLLLLPLIIAGFFLTKWLSLAAGILLIAGFALALFSCRQQAYQIMHGGLLCIQNTSFFTRQLIFLEKSKIQSLSRQTSKWLCRKKIENLELWMKSGAGSECIELHFASSAALDEISGFYRK